VRALADDVLEAVATVAQPPIPRDDVALAVRFTVRSMRDVPRDLLAIRDDVWAGPAPRVQVESVVPEDPEARAAGSEVAAIVRGTWEAPDWRGPDRVLARDDPGRPLRTGTRPVGFVLALPRAALEAPVPVTLHQHGSPGSADEEVLAAARSHLAAAGFAAIGFTDVLNREVSPPGPPDVVRARRQLADLLLRLLVSREVPDYFVQTNGEQLAFLRAIGELGRMGPFALDGPEPFASDGPEPFAPAFVFGIDPALPVTYSGVSEGANLGSSLLPYAPEIRAAALVAGGRRFGEVLNHQQADAVLAELSRIGFRDLAPTDVWVGLSLFQTLLDPQDGHSHARFLYREPLPIPGTARRASVLLVEGLGDTLVPNHATEALALDLGPVAHLGPGSPLLPFLEAVRGPVLANVDAHTTAVLARYVPEGFDGLAPTPGCVHLEEPSAREGHYCAQLAEESLLQRAVFFETALDDAAPAVIDSHSP
jgi:hypothetical protein